MILLGLYSRYFPECELISAPLISFALRWAGEVTLVLRVKIVSVMEQQRDAGVPLRFDTVALEVSFLI